MTTKKTWNQQIIKQENKSLVMQLLIKSSPISRAEIATLTGLNKGTVSSLVAELLEEQLIYEAGQGKSSGGRRPVLLFFNEHAGHAIGIDIGVNYLLGILTDLQGNILHENKVHFSNSTYKQIEIELYQMIDSLFAFAPSSPYGIVGIGIGVPGAVHHNGDILLAPNLNWNNVHLKEIVEKKYEVPIIIENEANAGAYGEKRFGVGKDFTNIIYISVGIGIGVGLILNDSLYKGKSGFSGELGHMTIEVNGLSCSCGSEGCWERYASEKALLNHAKALNIALPSNEELSLETLLTLAEKGHTETITLFEEIGNYLGVGIKNIMNIFNPEQIIIGNQIAAAEKWLEKPLHRQLNQTIWFKEDPIQLNFINEKTPSTALGVAAFSIENFFVE